MQRPFFVALVGLAAFGLLVACGGTGASGGGGSGGRGVGGTGGVSPESNWPSFGRDLLHTRSNPAETAIGVDTVANLELAWEHQGTEVTSTPSVVDGIVYFADWEGFVYAKRASDGSEVWTTKLDVGASGSLAIGEDRIFFGDFAGFVQSLDRATGRVLWSVPLDDHPNVNISSSPTLVDDMLIIGVASGELGAEREEYTFRGSIVGLLQADGAELWRIYVTEDDEESGAGVSVWSSASVDVDLGLGFIGTGQSYEEPAGPLSDSLVAFDYETGEIEWSRQFTPNDVYRIYQPLPQGPDADIGAAPNLFTVDDRDVVGVGDKGGLYAVFDRATGADVWSTQLGPGSHLGGQMGPAAYHDGRLYVTSNRWPSGFDTENVFFPDFDDYRNTSDLIALDATDGTELWRTSIASPTIGGTMYANGVVYSSHTLGLVQAFDASDGTELWSDQAGATLASGQVVYDGLLLVTHGFQFIGIEGNPTGFKGGLRVYELP